MLTKIKNLASLYRQLGFRWSAFRLAYAFRLRTGLIRLQTPQYKWTDRPLNFWLKKNIPSDIEAYAQYRKNNSPKFFFDSNVGARSSRPTWNTQPAIDETDKLLSGEIKYFSHQFHKIGFPPNWHTDPVSNLQSPKNKHWSQITDDYVVARSGVKHHDEAISHYKEVASSPKNKSGDSQRHVDIKFIWEPNRFAFVYTLVRAYAGTQDEKYAQAFWTLIEDWAKHNPPNTGANWKDGQEISLRLMAWVFGYYAFIHSPLTTPQRIADFTIFVAAQAERIYKNIDYAISTKSNHTISEAFGLWMISLLFPELKDSEKYFSLGKKILEEEIKQIFPDGSYSMYSLNYHRFILHIYLYAIRLGEINHFPLSTNIKQSVSKSIDYLSQLIDPQTGQIPFYGSNDGALVLPLNNCDFTDFRPLLQLGSYITKKELLFESGAWDEDIFWLCDLTPNPSPKRRGERLSSPTGRMAGDEGGTYILKNTNSKAIIHCRDFKSRPSHADQLHLDLGLGNQNIAIDAGTYLYSGEGLWRNGLAHTSAHNTVIVDDKDQMSMVSRFTWTNWSKGKVLGHKENLWHGEHDGYKPVIHQRKVMSLDLDRWLVIDTLNANESHNYKLHWLLSDFPYEQKLNSILLSLDSVKYKMQIGVVNGKGDLSLVRADENSTRGWRSRYYGHKEPAISVQLETNQNNATFWTFFGFENDEFEITENAFKLNKLVTDY
ncbi:MAG: alginate lyase family protein [Anaerolineales bacterium]|nr:alginate lyase family protein [Anaerolineales bacterium]MBX3037482.1 alginate lyase family protein [Anaerolineales bacterium]